MIRYENECVGCPPELGCLGNSCPNRNVERHYCDECGIEIEPDIELYDGLELCDKCKEKERNSSRSNS